MKPKSTGRRTFLKTTAAATAGAGLAMGMPARSYGRILGANERVVVAVMGTNGRGSALARGFASLENAEVAYICDVDERAVAKGLDTISARQERTAQGLRDFRRTLDEAGVDALVIAAPDHWHGPATILACAAGKHVYVEKPASHNPREGELMIEAARKYDRVVQMGNQRRSWPSVIDAIEAVREGRIGPVHYARSWYANGRESIGYGSITDVPAWLDWTLWQGPAPRTAYRDNVVHYNWHWFWHWGTGEACNNGVHAVDLCRWALGVDYPVRVTSTGGRYYWDDDAETPDTHVLGFEFEDEKAIMWEGLSTNRYGIGGSGFGASFHGEKGALEIIGNGYTVYDEQKNVVEEVNAQNAREATDASGNRLDLDTVHLYNFVETVRGNARLTSEIEEGHKSTLLCHLGNIAYRVGRTLTCDPQNGHIRGDEEAAALWHREYEPGWTPTV